MTTDDIQYLNWQWVANNPESALDLLRRFHREKAELRNFRTEQLERENAELRLQIAALSGDLKHR